MDTHFFRNHYWHHFLGHQHMNHINLLPLDKRMTIDDLARKETERYELRSCKGVTIIPHGGDKPVRLAPQHDYPRPSGEPQQDYCVRCYEIVQNYVKHGMKVI